MSCLGVADTATRVRLAAVSRNGDLTRALKRLPPAGSLAQRMPMRGARGSRGPRTDSWQPRAGSRFARARHHPGGADAVWHTQETGQQHAGVAQWQSNR
ncbi:hypothetical protein, partial [Frankia sp. Cj3]|uniref:hypothetical protein n=1 Tax=Frankia sp. Cj3 TaxID=2880976 RepID=UPI001EF3DE31